MIIFVFVIIGRFCCQFLHPAFLSLHVCPLAALRCLLFDLYSKYLSNPWSCFIKKTLDLHNWCWNARYEYQLCVSMFFRISLRNFLVGECLLHLCILAEGTLNKNEMHIGTGSTFAACCAFRSTGVFFLSIWWGWKVYIKHLKTLLCTYMLLLILCL